MIESQFDTNDSLSLAPRANVRKQGKDMIAVASGKGGVGKTWFSITLAHAFARTGRRVLLFDGDLGLANIDIQLGLMTDFDIGTVIANKKTLNQIITHYEEGNFDVIAGRSGSGGLSNIPLGKLQTLRDDLKLLTSNYDKLIVDLGAGIEKPVREFTKAVGTTLVVCTDEPTSLTDAYAFIKVTAMEQPDAQIKIVINAANTRREGERTFNTLKKACQGFLKIDPQLAGIVRRDTKVRDAIRNQTSILTRHPFCPASEDVENIAKNLL